MTRRSKYLLKKYGINEVEYNRKLKAQDHRCAICKKHKSEFSYSLHVDHSHKTGKIRGLLCYYCNKFRVGRHDRKSAFELYKYMVLYGG
jgi:hypothetical protein